MSSPDVNNARRSAADLRKLPWSAHDGERITLRRGKGGGKVEVSSRVHEGAQAHARRYVEKAPSVASVPAGIEHGRQLVEAENGLSVESAAAHTEAFWLHR